jgi:hypothetical protein
VPRSINKCPHCREPVSPFAAGCAICGYDLMTARAELAERRSRLGVDRLPQLRLGDDWLMFAIALLVALAAPLIGLIFGAFLAWHADNDRQIRRRNLMLVVVAVAAIALITGYSIFGRPIPGA